MHAKQHTDLAAWSNRTPSVHDDAWRERAERVVSPLQLYASPTLSASEIGQFEYCPQAWFFARCDIPVDLEARLRLTAGARAHRRICRRTDLVRASEAVKLVLLLGMAVLAAVAAIVAVRGAIVMLLATLIVLLLSCLATYVALATWARRQRRQLGLSGGRVEAADDSRLGSATLRSDRLGLVARPDHVLNIGGMSIPVEQKPSARRVWPSHMLQIAAQCVLVEEVSGVRPTHGVLVLARGRQERVPFTRELEQALMQTMQRMRATLQSTEAPGPYWSRGKCMSCGYRQLCWGRDE